MFCVAIPLPQIGSYYIAAFTNTVEMHKTKANLGAPRKTNDLNFTKKDIESTIIIRLFLKAS